MSDVSYGREADERIERLRAENERLKKELAAFRKCREKIDCLARADSGVTRQFPVCSKEPAQDDTENSGVFPEGWLRFHG